MLAQPLRHVAAVLLTFGTVLTFTPQQAAAQQKPAKPPLTVVQALYTPVPITLDGDRTSGVWAAATAYPMSFAGDKSYGTPSEPGNVRFFWSDTHFYAAFEVTDRDIIQESDKDQDAHYRTGDVMELFLKPDGGNWYWEFYVTPNAKRTAFFYPGRGRLSLPSTLDDYSHTQLAVSANVDGELNNWHTVDNGWIGLMAIPLEELGAPGIALAPAATPQWRVLAARYNFGQQLYDRELSSYPPQSRTNFHMLDEWAPLELVGAPKNERPLIRNTAEVALPQALVAQDGTAVTTGQQWLENRRPELLGLFAEHIYGQSPSARPDDLRFEVTQERPAFDGLATFRQVDVSYSGPSGKGELPFRLYTPNAEAKPKAVFITIFVGQREGFDKAETEATGRLPLRDLLERGYAVAAFFKDDAGVDDKDNAFSNGPFPAYRSKSGERAGNDWGTIAAWSWNMSRIIDVLEQMPQLADAPVAVVGHSRGGKAALWAGAQDERIDLTVSNNSGTAGTAIARTSRGETIQQINDRFPHWFAPNYTAYNGNPAALPVDQHQLIALVAPRLVYVASASEDAWADPQAEFQGAREASVVYELLGLRGMSRTAIPAADRDPVHHGRIGYHLREGKHDLTAEDWKLFADFADLHWHTTEPPLPKGTIAPQQ